MLKTSEKQLVEFGLQVNIIPPLCFGWEVTREGHGKFFPSVGGINIAKVESNSLLTNCLSAGC